TVGLDPGDAVREPLSSGHSPRGVPLDAALEAPTGTDEHEPLLPDARAVVPSDVGVHDGAPCRVDRATEVLDALRVIVGCGCEPATPSGCPMSTLSGIACEQETHCDLWVADR